MSDINDTGQPGEDELSREFSPDDGLTAKQRRFVDEYLVDRNGPAAAQRAGYSPRSASSLLQNPAIQDAITARQQATDKPVQPLDGDAVTLQLIAEADAAYKAAEASNNSSGMTSAVQLKARLHGVLRGSELAPEAVAKPATDLPSMRELVRTMHSMMRQFADEHREYRACLLQWAKEDSVLPPSDAEIYKDFNGNFPMPLSASSDGPRSILDVQEGIRTPAVAPAPVTSPAPDPKSHHGEASSSARKFQVGESEVFDTGCHVTLELDSITGRHRWALFNRAGEHCGFKSDIAAARAWADSVTQPNIPPSDPAVNVRHVGEEQTPYDPQMADIDIVKEQRLREVPKPPLRVLRRPGWRGPV
jgi:hypothetical protein